MSDTAAPVAMTDVPAVAPDTLATAVTAPAVDASSGSSSSSSSGSSVAAPAAAPAATAADPAAAVAVAAPPAAPVVPRVLPHPKEYYEVPSTTSNALLPRYSPEQLAAMAALQPESAGYTSVIRKHLVNPFRESQPKLPLVVPPAGSGLPTPSPEAQAQAESNAQADEDAPAAKRARSEPAAHDPNAPASSSCAVHEHGPRGDEFDMEEAAGARDHVKTSEQADAAQANAAAPASAAAPAAAPTAAAADAVPAAAAAGDATREKRKRARGQNKNSEREFFSTKDTIEGQICRVIVSGATCTRGDKCRYSHDLAAYKAAVLSSQFPGVCPLFARYGTCPTGATMCKWGAQGHAEEHRPANPAVLAKELNMLPASVSSELKSTPLGGPKYEKTFPRTVALTKRYEAWRKKVEQIRNQRQKEKEAALRLQNAEAKAAAAAAAAAKAAKEAPAAPTAAAAPAVPAAADGTGAAPAAAASPAVASSSASAASSAPATGAAAAAPAAASLPPSFMPHSAEVEIEIAALKATYTPEFPHSVDPFQIVSEAYSDWSSGCLLIDLERKPLDFSNKLVLAPLTTVGNLPFRRVCKSFGADVTIGEMALSNSLGKGAANEWALTRRHESEKFFGIQLAASHPDQVSRACEYIAKHCQADFVDLNIGCPIDQVTDKGMGSAMMQRKRMKNLEPIMRTMRTMLDCPATIKMRMGWSTTELTALDLLPIVNRCGLSAVTVHGRTRQQRYTKSANWDYIKEAATFAKEKCNGLPLIANGDVYSFEDYEEIVNPSSDVTTVMIARGALVKPWIFQEIRERRHIDISAGERLDMLRDFVRYGHEHFGTDTKGVESTRRFLLEMLSFLHRYMPVGLLERPRVSIQQKNPPFYARSDLEQLLSSPDAKDWIRISEMLIGPVPDGFRFTPKHKSSTQSEESNG